MKNVLTSEKRGVRQMSSLRFRMMSLTTVIVSLFMLLGAKTATAQDCSGSQFTINLPEALPGASTETTIVVPIKEAYNVKTFVITPITTGLVLTKTTGEITVDGSKKGVITFTAAKDGKALPAGDYCFQVVMTSADGCSSVAGVFTVSVKGRPVVNVDPFGPICSAVNNNLSVTGSIVAISGATLSYIWMADIQTIGVNESDITGYTASGSGNNGTVSITGSLTNKTKKEVVIRYSVTPQAVYAAGNTTVIGETKTVDVTIYPELDLTVPGEQTVCTGTTLDLAITSGITGAKNTVSWTSAVSGEGVSITGAGAATDVAFGETSKIKDQVINTGKAAGTVTYTITQKYDACTSAAQTLVVNVNPTPVVTLTAPISAICDGGEGGVTLGTGYTGVVYDITVAENTNVTGQHAETVNTAGEWKTGTLTLKSGVVTVQSLTYTITPKIGDCAGTPETYTVQISPLPTISLSNPKNQICNATTGTVNVASNVSGATYEILATLNANVDGEDENITAPTGSLWTTPTLTNTTGNFQTVKYTIKANMNGCLSTVGADYDVTVVPTITLDDPTNAPIVVCSADATGTTVTFTSPGLAQDVANMVTYDWSFTYNSNNLTVVGSGITISGSGENTTASGTGTFPLITITNKLNVQVPVNVDVVATYGKGSLNCGQVRKQFTITVNPKPSFQFGE